MDWLQVIANIAQVLGVIWLFAFGGKAVVEVVRDLLQGRRPVRMPKASTITNVLLALIFLAIISLRFALPSPSPNKGSSSISATPTSPSIATTATPTFSNSPSPTRTIAPPTPSPSIVVTNSPTIAPSTPLKTLQTLCNAAVREDYQTQWNQFDYTYATGNWGNESMYASDLKNRDASHNGVANCTVTNVTQNGSSASGTTTTTFVDGTTDTVLFSLNKQGDDVWRITGLQKE